QVVALGEDAGLVQQPLGVLLARLGQVHLLALLVHPVIADAVLDLLPGQVRHHLVDLDVELGRLVGRAGDDQRGARLVDQDRVDLVDDGVVQAALVAVGLGHRHVVAQVVEAELVVGAVGDVGAVGRVLVGVLHARVDHADRQPQPVVQLAHLGGVAAGEVVIDRDHVHALALQGIEVARQGGDQGLALAGAHLGDLAHVQHHAADQLHVVVAHAQHAHAGLAAHGEGLGQHLVQRLAVGHALAEFGGLGLEFGVGQRLHLRLEGVDLPDDPAQLLDEAVVAAAEDAGEQAIEHWGTGYSDGDLAGAGSGAPATKQGATGALCDGTADRTVFATGDSSTGGGRTPASPAHRAGGYLSTTSPRNLRWLCRRPFSQTSRCTWTPVERPVEPVLATC